MRRVAYTPTEAALIAGLPTKAVNKIIDTDRLGEGSPRQLGPRDLLYMIVVSRLRSMAELKPQGRTQIRKALTGLPSTKLKARGELSLTLAKDIRLDLKPFVTTMIRGLQDLKNAQEAVVEDPEIMGGETVLKRTRIPVYLVGAMLSDGASVDEISAAYPSLSRRQIELAMIYTSAYPRRGRPAKRPWKRVL
jgi:uncharacterized protein (DUF433 family)